MHPFDPARGATRTALAILFFCFAANTVLRGIQDSYAIFLLPIAGEFDLLRGEVSSVYSITFAVVGLSGPIVGSLFDKWGPKRLYLGGIAAAALGCVLASQVQALWQFYVVLGLLFGFAAASVGFVPMAAMLSRWFSKRRNTALAIGHASQGAGILLLAPTAQALIDAFGWRQAYMSFALVTLVLLPLFLLIPWRAAQDGHPAYHRRQSATDGATPSRLRDEDPTLAQALRTPAFWGITLAFFCTSLGMFTISLQTPAYLISIGYSPQAAANAFGLIGMLLPAGMIGFGWLGDRIGRRRVVLISYSGTLIGIAALLAMHDGPSLPALALFIIAFGGTFGSRGPAISTIASIIFGGANFGRIYGCITIGMGLGGATGAWAGGFLHDVTGSYTTGQIVAMLAIACGAAPFVLIRTIART
jgi:MFS family permease